MRNRKVSRLGGAAIEKYDLHTCAKIEKNLTIPVHNIGTGRTTKFKAYESVRSYLYVPRAYAKAELGIAPKTTTGEALGELTMTPVQLKDYQTPFVADIVRAFNDEEDLRIEAATGKGKSVMSLEVSRRLGRKILILVDQEFLRDQWINAAVELFEVNRSDIGIVQGTEIDWEGKAIVVGMIQTLYQKEMPKEFYNYFGTLILDESHTFGAPQFSKILMRTPQRYRLAISATSERTDELDKVLEYNLGPVRLKLAHRHRKSKVRYVTYRGNCYSKQANESSKTGKYISEISEDGYRNLYIVEIIKQLKLTGRDILAVSDRLDHLCCLRDMLVLSGVPEDDIGIVAGRKIIWKYAKCLRPKQLPAHYVQGTDYTPVILQRVRKKYTKAELESSKETKKIVLATYGMFEKGVDVPRMSAGLDCSPRAKAEQLHGRILRDMEGKLTPVWVTIRDIESRRAEYQFSKRLSDYLKSNAEVFEWDLNRGVRSVDVKRLQGKIEKRIAQMRLGKIIMKLDGNFTVVMPSIVQGQKKVR